MSTAIEWTDETWNPVVGCSKVSEGCRNCYAIRQAFRNEHMRQPAYVGLTRKLADNSLNWTGVVRCLPERLTIPLGWRKPRRIFVNSMSDLFHDSVPDAFIAQVFAVMALADRHTFQVLTKRPERMAHLLGQDAFVDLVLDAAEPFQALAGHDEDGAFHWPSWVIEHWPLGNVWLGTSVEDQQAADERIPHLLQTPAAVRFLSCEPLLGSVYLSPDWMMGLDQLICGGESGPKARPMHPSWARSLRAQCAAARVPFFFKQWGGVHPGGDAKLDGREWHEFPEGRLP
ncbi:MAG: phage Gp37/Gp68 family protein [Acidobacteria bacterium]|nr:phage Gp37/Gp68 family protein [Acidobacteriota bacterium]